MIRPDTTRCRAARWRRAAWISFSRPQDIAEELARIAKHPFVAGQPSELASPRGETAVATAHEDDERRCPRADADAATGARQRAPRPSAARKRTGHENGFKKILLLLRNHSGVDFSLYKSTTIQRRITRRMVLNKQNTLEDYADFLRGNAKELDALYSDVLISVTSFFRNPEAFDVLKQRFFPSSSSSAATSRCASGCSAVPPARRRIPSPWRSWKLREKAPRARASSRSSPPTSTRRCSTRPATASTPRAWRRMSRRSGCGGFSSRRKAATGSARRCARWSSSPGRTSSATRRSRAWTSSVAATC